MIKCNKDRETPNTGNISDTNEWMNPDAKLSEIVFKLNFFISWPNFIKKRFSRHSGHIQRFNVPWNDPCHAPFEKDTRPKLFMANPSLHLIITINDIQKLSPTCDKSYLSWYYSSLHISLGIINGLEVVQL